MQYIVHLTTVHIPFDTRIFQKECRTLVQAGYRVSLIASHTRHEVVDGVEIVPIPSYSRRIVRILLSPWAAYRIARRLQADLYHFHDPELLPVGVLLKWTTRVRVIYDVHENHAKKMQARQWLPRSLRKVVSSTVRLIEQYSVNTFDAIVAATEHIAALFSHTKVVVVKNYPLLKFTSLPPGDQQHRADNHKIIYTGGWTGHRGVYQIIQALEYVRNPKVRLALLGRCIDPHVQEHAKMLPGFSKLDYFGLVPYEESYEHMRSSAIGLVCSQPRHDYDLAQPNKLFEYMSAGLPVIASHFPLWREIVEGSQCGVTVDPTQPEQIARSIDHLLAHPERRKQMGENGRRAVLETYNWQVEGQKLLALYEELLC